MKIFQGTKSLPAPLARSVLTIGNFDGVHLGHRELISRVLKRSQVSGTPSVVMTFDPHPMTVLRPDRHLKRLFSTEDQHHELEKLGVDTLIIEPFSREFSQLSPQSYLRDWIQALLHPELLVVGHDFNFGANRSGTLEYLKTESASLGFEVDIVAPVKVGSEIVSSTRIRQAVDVGDVEGASQFLGREFYIEGLVEKGAGRGRTIGVPTANVRTAAELTPALGVYAATVDVGGKRWKAAVNIGHNPTFQAEGVVSIEAHLLEFTGDIYGMPVRVNFVKRLRDEKKFSGVDALVTQIKLDLESAKSILKGKA